MKSALSTNPAEKKTNMDSATKIFDESYKGHGGKRNMFAAMARARILFANRKYAHALEGYQEVLLHRPDMDPDPRIGIGLCYWALGYKDDAKLAWERAMEIVCLYGVSIGSAMKLDRPNNFSRTPTPKLPISFSLYITSALPQISLNHLRNLQKTTGVQ